MDTNIKGTEDAIAELISATARSGASAKEKHVLREALRALVRLAKTEQMLEIKGSVRKLTTLPCPSALH